MASMNTKIFKYQFFKKMTLYLTYFDSFFDVFSLFLMISKWRENPQTEGPHIFATLKLQKQFWKLLQSMTSLAHNSSSKCGIYRFVQVNK